MQEMEKWKNDYLKIIGDTYKNHVNKFIDYLKYINKLDTPNKINIEDVSQCVGYYVKNGAILSISSMELHLESLKSFYDYLLKSGKSNDIFSQMDYEEYKKYLINKFGLAEKVSREIFSIETMKDLLAKLDEEIDKDYFGIIGKQERKRHIHYMALTLFIKITLIAPAKRQVIGNITLANFDTDLRKININGVEISVPNSLRKDIITSINLREKISNIKIDKDENIFKYIIQGKFTEEKLNQWFCTFIKKHDVIGIQKPSDECTTYAIEPIMKTAISNLVRGMANLAYISKISGIKISTLEETYYKELFDENSRKVSVGEAIDWEIRKSGYYSYI